MRRNIEILEGLRSIRTFLYDLLFKFCADDMLFRQLADFKEASPSQRLLWLEMLGSYKVSESRQIQTTKLMYEENPPLSYELKFHTEKLETYERKPEEEKQKRESEHEDATEALSLTHERREQMAVLLRKAEKMPADLLRFLQ